MRMGKEKTSETSEEVLGSAEEGVVGVEETASDTPMREDADSSAEMGPGGEDAGESELAQSGAELSGEEPQSPPAEMAQLLEDARSRADEHWNQVLRLNAELENLRKRYQRELHTARSFAIERFVQELLPVRDSLELGISAAQDESVDVAKLREGGELTLKLLSSVMEKFHIREVDPQGEKFDPQLHQAMSMQEVEGVEPNTVVSVIQKGYLLHERLIRPAMVIVSK
jgi:molecular chaperone GrpE